MDIRIRKRFPKHFILLVLLLALKMNALNLTNAFDQTFENVKRNNQASEDINQKIGVHMENHYDNKNPRTMVGGFLDNGTDFAKTEEKQKYLKEEHGDETGIIEQKEQEKSIERENVIEKEEVEKSAKGTTKKDEIFINKTEDYLLHENELESNNLGKRNESLMSNEKVDSQKEEDNLIPDVIDLERGSLQKEENVSTSTYRENKEIDKCERKEGDEVRGKCISSPTEETKKKKIIEENISWEGGNDKETTIHILNDINYNSKINGNQMLNEKKQNVDNNVDDIRSNKEFHDVIETMDTENKEENVDTTKDDDGVDGLWKYKTENQYNKENSLFSTSENTESKTNVSDIMDTLSNASNINDEEVGKGVNGTLKSEQNEKFQKEEEEKKGKEYITEHISSHNITDIDKTTMKKVAPTYKLTEQEPDTQQDVSGDLPNKFILHDKGDNVDKDIEKGTNIRETYMTDLHKKRNERDGANTDEGDIDFNVTSSTDEINGKVLELFFTENANLYTNVKIGNQMLKIGLSSRLEGIYVFMKNSPSCYENVDISEKSEDYKKEYAKENNVIHDEEKKKIIEQVTEKNCYDPHISKSARWCNNNSMCLPAILAKPYKCYSEDNLYINNKVEYPSIYYDSLKFNDSHIEGSDHVELFITDNSDSFHLQTIENRENNSEQNTKNNKEEKGLVKDIKTDSVNDSVTNYVNNYVTNSVTNFVTNSVNNFGNNLNNDFINNPNNDPSNEPVSNPFNNFSNVRKFVEEETNIEKNKTDIMHLKERGSKSKGSISFESADIKLVVDMTLYKNWSTFKDVEGILGLAGGELSCRNKSVWNAIIEEHSFLFAVDINLPEEFVKPYINGEKDSTVMEEEKKGGVFFVKVKKESDPNKSEIHIGYYKKEYGEIIWAEPRERGGIFSDSLLQFTMYNLEVCGQNIFGKYSSNWQGVVDLSSKCLILPKMFWLSLMEYLPINRNDKRCIPENKGDEYVDDVLPRMCSVDEANRPLPLLKFVFSDNDIVNNNNINTSDVNMKEIHIPLDNLIIRGDKENENYLCVIPDSKEGRNTEISGRTAKPLIKFGTYVLNNLYIVADQDNYRIGFAQKKIIIIQMISVHNLWNVLGINIMNML